MTAYDVRISDWSSDVCSSDLLSHSSGFGLATTLPIILGACAAAALLVLLVGTGLGDVLARHATIQTLLSLAGIAWLSWMAWQIFSAPAEVIDPARHIDGPRLGLAGEATLAFRSEEDQYELQHLMHL